MAVTTIYQLKTFNDIVLAIMEELKIQSTDTTTKNRIKRALNILYVSEVAPYTKWPWRRGYAAVVHEPAIDDGTATVTEGSTTVTLTDAPAISRKGHLFKVDGYNEIYKIAQHTAASTTITLSSPYTSTTDSDATYQIWTEEIPLPSDCAETIKVTHDFQTEEVENWGLNKFREIVTTAPVAEGRPRIYSLGDFVEGAPYESISGLPATSTRASSGLVKTIVFASSVAAYLQVGDRIEISSAGHRAYNGEVIVASVSTTTITYVTTVALAESATSDTGISVAKLSSEASTERYRNLLVYPSINNVRTTLHVEYKKIVPPLIEDDDEPLMPLEDRVVLLYGGAQWAWSSVGRNPEEAKRNFDLYQNKIARMAGRMEDSRDLPVLKPSKLYLGAKRNAKRVRDGRIPNDFAGAGGGSSSADPITGTASRVAVFDSLGELGASTSITTTELGYLDGLTSTAVGITDTQTLTNKTIDADDNTISNLAHGAEVDSPSSGVHGVTGSVVGTSDIQTLTNKTIDADSNTITNIENADIKSGAAIARNKTASGTAYRILANDASGVMSENAALTATHVVYADANGQLAGEAALDETRGGTAQTTYTTGDLLYASASNTLSKLGIGSSGQQLTVSGGVPVWSAASSTISLTSIDNGDSPYTALTSDELILCDSSGGAITINLFAASGNSGKILRFKKTSSDYTAITIDGNSSETIDGSTTTTINTQYEELAIVCDGSNWHILDRRIISAWATVTLTGTWSTNTTYHGMERRVGDCLEIRGYLVLAGAPDTVGLTITLPHSLEIDGAKLPNSGGGDGFVGWCKVNDASAGLLTGVCDYASNTTFNFACFPGSSASNHYLVTITESTPLTFGNTDEVHFHVLLPISGWKA